MKAYLKLELNFFEAPVYMEMRAIEGCTGEGCVLALMRYLRTCPKGTGYLAALKNIAHDCRKSKTYFLTSSMRHPNYNSLIDNLKERPDGEVFLGKK